ncbi:MAG: hypothetical protein K0S33_502 [Bacteroidetes bacterium]|jgi:hypothetical protein|nr:hypothetical protein [Bacteroidota bacterium]
MSTEINFSDLWHGQSAPEPSVDELIAKAKTLKNKTRNKLIGLSLLMLATMAFICWIAFYAHPQMLTTTIGIGLTILAIVMNVVYNTGSLQLLLKKNTDVSSTSYLQQLIRLKQKQEFMHRVIMSLYFIFLCTGVFLYMIEYTIRMEWGSAIAVYVITAAWFAFSWFYLRPRTIKKQQSEINGLITEFERINKQFSE